MRAVFLAMLLAGQAARADVAATDELRFVTCPIYRDADAGKKSGCWLADDPATGTRYDVSPSPAKPDWNLAVLVEGRRAADQTDRCGGVVLDPARVSILPGIACTRAMLPAEGFTGRKFVLPERNVHPLYAHRTPAAAPFGTKRFAIPFDYARDFVTYQLADYFIDKAILYAGDIGKARIRITGHADTRPTLISGERLAEPAAFARSRAEKVADWFRMRGVPAKSIEVRWTATATVSQDPAFDGLVAPSFRRVDIEIAPVTTGVTASPQGRSAPHPAAPTGGDRHGAA